MNQSSIYHGGGFGGCGGFGGAPAASEKYLFERIWIPANDLKALSSNPPNGPSTRVLPNTVNTFVWIFTALELDLAFAWFHLPSRYWKYDFTAPTECTLRIYWYTDFTAATIIRWKAELNYVRNGETANFVPPALGTYDVAAGTQYVLNVLTVPDFPINNPSGSILETEGAFYLKLGRDGANAADTFPQEAYILGASVEIPLKYP
jgi:hypothetical protein